MTLQKKLVLAALSGVGLGYALPYQFRRWRDSSLVDYWGGELIEAHLASIVIALMVVPAALTTRGWRPGRLGRAVMVAASVPAFAVFMLMLFAYASSTTILPGPGFALHLLAGTAGAAAVVVARRRASGPATAW